LLGGKLVYVQTSTTVLPAGLSCGYSSEPEGMLLLVG